MPRSLTDESQIVQSEIAGGPLATAIKFMYPRQFHKCRERQHTINTYSTEQRKRERNESRKKTETNEFSAIYAIDLTVREQPFKNVTCFP